MSSVLSKRPLTLHRLWNHLCIKQCTLTSAAIPPALKAHYYSVPTGWLLMTGSAVCILKVSREKRNRLHWSCCFNFVLLQECEKLRSDNEELKRRTSYFQRENTRIQQRNIDLSRQVGHFLATQSVILCFLTLVQVLEFSRSLQIVSDVDQSYFLAKKRESLAVRVVGL